MHKKASIFILLAALLTTPSLLVAKATDDSAQQQQFVTQRVIHIVNEQWGIATDKMSTSSYFLTDFGADNLDIIELVMALEEDFDIVIADNKWQEVTTIRSLVDLIIDIQE